jgi:Domain of unknown function (DUF6898)
MHGQDLAMGKEVIIEFHQVGAYVKVSAIDPKSLTEVSIVGDPNVGEAMLKRAAIRKLNYVMARNAGGKPPNRGRSPN